jgi:hypothetical protein
MKKFYSLFLGIFLVLLCSSAYAQISVTATSGTTGPTTYTTLKAAFDAINAGTHKGSITINVTGNTTETAAAVLNAPTGTASYSAVNVTTSGTFTISSATNTPIIGLNGATNFTLNGNNTLTLSNTNAAGSVIGFATDASNNTIKNAILRGVTSSMTATAPFTPTLGIVSFGLGVTNGNDDNTIENCEIDGSGSAACAIFSKGSTASSTIENSDMIIKNNRIHDCRNATAPITIFLTDGNTAWTFEGNSLYNTAAYSTTAQIIVRAMLILPDWTSDFHIITGNFIGGNAPNAVGTMSLTSSDVVGFIGMDVETGGGNLINNNTIKGITLSYASNLGTFSNSGYFGFIGGFNGFSLVQNNTVSDISVTNSQGFISFSGFHMNARVTGTDTVKAQFSLLGNTVNNITGNSGNYPVGDVQIHGFRLETSSSGSLAAASVANPVFVVKQNVITNISAPFNGGFTFIRGIGTANTNGSGSVAQLFPRVIIDSNSISGFTTTSGNANFNSAGSYASGALTGIHFGGSANGSNATNVQFIRGNTISNFSATNADSATAVIGILATTGVHDVSRNKIFDLRNSAVAGSVTPRPGIVGINIRSAVGASTYANNMISLGNNVTGNEQIFGILNAFTATGPLNIYYNTVVISGAGAAGNTRNTAAFMRGTEVFGNTITTPVNLKDNILINTRTGGGSHYAIVNATGTSTGWTSDYNNLYTANAATLGLWGTTSTDFATWKTTSGQDANSKNVTVTFTNVATGDLHLSGASTTDVNLNGSPVTGITIDYDSETRSATTPKMGADEPVPCVAPVITTNPTTQSVCAGNSVTLTAAATGTSVGYQWRKNTVAITGATSSSYTILLATASDAGSYDVVVTNLCGTATSTAATLTVNPTTVITAAPVAQSVCIGSTATFTVTATGSGTLTYQWKKAGTNIAGATSATYSIVNAQAGDAGQYSVTVTSPNCGSVTTTPVQLTMVNCTAVPSLSADVTSAVMMPSIVRNQSQLRIVVKRSMKIDYVVTDATGTVVMRFSRQAVAGSNDVPLTLQNLAAGTYQVVATGTSGRLATIRFVKQ